MPTIKDIAAEAGVSHGTVSNVLNKKGNVSAEKIQLVEQIANKMGYKFQGTKKRRKRIPRTWDCAFSLSVCQYEIKKQTSAHGFFRLCFLFPQVFLCG